MPDKLSTFLDRLSKEVSKTSYEIDTPNMLRYIKYALPDKPIISTWYLDYEVDLITYDIPIKDKRFGLQILVIENGISLYEFIFTTDVFRYDVSRLEHVSRVEEFSERSLALPPRKFIIEISVGGSFLRTILKTELKEDPQYDDFTRFVRNSFVQARRG